MKKLLLFKTLVVLTLLASALGARAATATFSSDGIYYQLTTYSDGSGVLSVQNSGSFNTYSGVVHIPDSVNYNGVYYPVTGIGYQAFKNCTGLIGVTIPEGVTMLLNESFAGCTQLAFITLPSTMMTIYNNAFVGCTQLGLVMCMNPNPRSMNSNNFDASTYSNATLIVPQGSLSNYQNTSAWSQFSNIQEQNKFVVDGIYYTITGSNTVSVTYRDGLYSSYYGDVYIPETVTYRGTTYRVTAIDESAFRLCRDPQGHLNVTIPNSVTSIGTRAFYGSELYYIEMGRGISSIGAYAFDGTESTLNFVICHALTIPSIQINTFNDDIYANAYIWVPQFSIDAYKSSRYWGKFDEGNWFTCYDFVVDGVYYGINSVVNTVEVTALALAADTTSLFSAFSDIENMVIPPTVTYEGVEYTVNRIGAAAHYKWGMKNVTLPSTIKSIERNAYFGCENLEHINFSEGVTSIGNFAFDNCKSLQSVKIPNTVKRIDFGAFYDCTALDTLFLGAGVEQIGRYAFGTCTNLSIVLSFPLIPPVITDDVFADETYNEAKLYAAVSSLPAYQAAVGWRNFHHIVNMHTLDEALNAPGGNIHFEESDYTWIVWDDGERLFAMSGNAGVHNSSSTLSTTVRVSEPSVLSFDFKAWGESDPDNPNTDYDECVFMVNGYSIFRYGARDNDWETFTYELNPNVTYQLRWYYHKDVSDNGVGDYFALDNIKIAPKTMRGDVDGDGVVSIADVSALIDYILSGDATSINLTAADVDDDNIVSIADTSALIDYILSGEW